MQKKEEDKIITIKENIINENKEYLDKHPEICELINDFLSSVLKTKPENFLEFSSTFWGNLQRNCPLVIVGCSGVGKGTMIKSLMNAYPDFFGFSVSYTTRQARNNEINGINYNFVSMDSFKQEIEKNRFLEHCNVHGNYYGTHKRELEKIFQKGKIPILEVDIQGAKKIHEIYPKGVYIWISVSNLDELKIRLKGRNTDSEEVIKKRFENSKWEIKEIKESNLFKELKNDEIEKCFKNLVEVLQKAYPFLKF